MSQDQAVAARWGRASNQALGLLPLVLWALASCTDPGDDAGPAGEPGNNAGSSTIGPANDPAQLPVGGSTAACPDAEYPCGVFELVNQGRAAAGAAALAYNSELARAAQAHALDMQQQDYFSHESLDGRDFSDRVAETNYTGFAVAENIALGQRDPQQVMSSWMSSSGHRRNILSTGATEIGVGYVDGYWVQVFGRGRN